MGHNNALRVTCSSAMKIVLPGLHSQIGQSVRVRAAHELLRAGVEARRAYSKANASSRKPSASNGFTRSPVQRQAIWLYSVDTQLLKVGDETTIDYGYRYRVYIRRIREGLRNKKAWAIGLLQCWDPILFRTRTSPTNMTQQATRSSMMTKTSMIFLAKHRRPRTALFLQSPALHRTTAKTTSKAGHPPLPHPRIRATSRQAHRNYHPAPSPDCQLNHQTHRAPPPGRRPFLPLPRL
ncbi:hypothetical protein B0H13DRAFT_1896014 [Mycena leptocephala]|nr:hypothetical protein B0H13DRAFT_1896014 [Mycena leptocephala]